MRRLCIEIATLIFNGVLGIVHISNLVSGIHPNITVTFPQFIPY